MSNNFQINTPAKGWNDAPPIVIKEKDQKTIHSDELLLLIKDEPLLKDLSVLLEQRLLDDTAVSLIHEYLITGSKLYYQKLVAGYFEQYTWIPALRRIKLEKYRSGNK